MPMITNKKKYTGLALAALITLSLAGAALTAQAAPAAVSRQMASTPSAGSSAPAGTGLKTAGNQMKNFSGNAGLETADQSNLTSIIGKLLKGFLGLLGTVFVVLTIYAGFLWMTAQGNEEQITKSKKMLTNAVIGLIIVVLAYTITNFVLAALMTATTPG